MEVRTVKEIKVYSTRKENREEFARQMSAKIGLEITPVETAEKAVHGADIVLMAANAIVPVFKPEWIEKGMHLSMIKPGEFGPEVVRRADVKATLMGDCDPVFITSNGLKVPEEPGGDLQDLAREIGWQQLVTLPELLVDRLNGRNSNRGRTSDDQVTCLLNPLGLGYQFAAVGAIIYHRAREQGRGHELPTNWFSQKEIP